jgi:hypothetical protein
MTDSRLPLESNTLTDVAFAWRARTRRHSPPTAFRWVGSRESLTPQGNSE